LIVVNHEVIYWWNRNLASTYIDRALLKGWLLGNRQCNGNCPKIKIAIEVSVNRPATLATTCSNVEHRVYTGCPRRNGQNFGRVFLMLKYTDITQSTYIQSWMVTEIMAREVWNFDSCYTLITKFILKLAGICGFCNANICT